MARGEAGPGRDMDLLVDLLPDAASRCCVSPESPKS
ncbi:hypothetical protein [Nostocoides sp. Soil756]